MRTNAGPYVPGEGNMRGSGGTGQPTKPQRRKPGGRSKSQKEATTVAVGLEPSVAEPREQIASLTRELSEAREQQTATAEVLNVISRSAFQLQPVLDTIVQTASHLCNAETALIFMFREEKLHLVATNNASDAFINYITTHPLLPDRGSLAGRTFVEQKTVHIADCLADPEYTVLDYQTIGKYRSMLGVPLLREGAPIGIISLLRTVVMPFTDRQIDLVKTFADQAVIAIENARLFEAEQQHTRELTEALQQQTATAEVLKVISRSTFDLQTVLDTLMESATRLCDADHAWLFEREDEGLRWVASFGHATEVHAQIKEHFLTLLVPLDRGSVSGRTTLEGRVVHVPDVLTDPDYVWSGALKAQQIGNYRAALGVPLLRQGRVVGVIFITKTVPEPFTAKQIEVVTTFADQAVIAIENTRLLNELRESLQQQTATADVLKVISQSTFQVQPVFDAIVQTASRLCDAEWALIFMIRDDQYHVIAANNASDEFVKYVSAHPIPPGSGSLIGRTVLGQKTVHMPDCLADPEYRSQDFQAIGKYRSMLGVPLLREGLVIGVIGLFRTAVIPFTDQQIDLVETFADQAVIAIENARLFDEVRARTDELSEALRQQTATAEVLQVISRSAFDLQPVFDTVAESSVKLCDAERAVINRYDGELLRIVAAFNTPPEFKGWLARHPIRPGRQSAAARAALERRTVHIPDCQTDPEYSYEAKDVEPVRTVVAVPILKGDDLLGVIVIYRFEVRPFTDKQIALIETFADQSAIAIENARLFEEVQQRTEALTESLRQQTATADVLKVISRSTFDLPTVLRTLVESAARLCEAEKANIIRQKGGGLHVTEAYGYSQEFIEAVEDMPIEPTSGLASGRALLEGQIVHIPDVEADPEYTFTAKRLADIRTILAVPMLREGEAIGVLVLTRSDVQPFTDKQIETASTFADQAAIAIENVRLFESVETRTRELATSLEELRTAQDRLVQTEKLASLGQLTAGIAHEIKNPLNFVNNFSALAIDLIGELEEALQAARLDDKVKAQIAELADMLKGNLGKVVEHGKRADSIVKNMLLHSRQEAGEHRPVDINALIAESLNLAYHGARAAKQGFNITLEQSLDPAAGVVDVFPQEITRVVLNLISNGFYAAAKRKAETNSETYEPTLTATTRNLGDSVEIRIRDNGTGIPAEVKEKMFNPFFTTKPAGEGTGLGLSLSYDIIVKQHGGSIKVDTQAGEFTEFTIVLPRVAASVANSGERR